MCLYRRIRIYIYVMLSILRYKGLYNAQQKIMPEYIEDCEQDITEISNDKKVCVRRSVRVRLCSQHRRVCELTTL